MYEIGENNDVSNLGEDFIEDILPFLETNHDVPSVSCEGEEAKKPFSVCNELPPWTLDHTSKDCRPPQLGLEFPVLPPHSEVSESSGSVNSYAFCAVCTKPFNVRWNHAVRYEGLSFSCPTCFQNVFLSRIEEHRCFLRQDDGGFALCEQCFITFVAPQLAAGEDGIIESLDLGRGLPDISTNMGSGLEALQSGSGNCAESEAEKFSNVAFNQAILPEAELCRNGDIMTSVTEPSSTLSSTEDIISTPKRSAKRRGRKARCDLCKKTFANAQEKILHVRQLHQAAYRCHECGATLRNAENLRRHAMCHTRDARNVCARCGARFGHIRSLKAHARMCVGQQHRNADIEKVTLRTENDLVKPKDNAGGLEDCQKIFPCPICGKKFSVRPSVSRHIRIVHQELKPHECVTCGKSFSSRYNLNVHSLKNH